MQGDGNDGVKKQIGKVGMLSQKLPHGIAESEGTGKFVFKNHASQETFIRAMEERTVPGRAVSKAGETKAFWSKRPRA